MRRLRFLIPFLSLIFCWSCGPNKCSIDCPEGQCQFDNCFCQTCFNGGNCQGDSCRCPDNWEGKQCLIPANKKFEGVYEYLSGNQYRPQLSVLPNLEIRGDSLYPNEIHFQGLYPLPNREIPAWGNYNPRNHFRLSNQPINYFPPYTQMMGSGYLKEDTLFLSLKLSSPAGSTKESSPIYLKAQ